MNHLNLECVCVCIWYPHWNLYIFIQSIYNKTNPQNREILSFAKFGAFQWILQRQQYIKFKCLYICYSQRCWVKSCAIIAGIKRIEVGDTWISMVYCLIFGRKLNSQKHTHAHAHCINWKSKCKYSCLYPPPNFHLNRSLSISISV